ncbi:MAG: branched-chain amino acid ABC transporter permease [Deltaproteobacteria bacterium]|nr:branched-chain amino acid ABC transporter permease [Deltaproteobacteria bacterium]
MRSKSVVYLIFGLVVFLLPFLLPSDYWIYMFTMVGIYMILVGSLDLVYGYTGLVSLAHAAFFGIGAYSSAILQVKLGVPLIPALIAGTLITACIAVVIGWPMLRIRGPYFVLGTLAIGIAISIIIHNWNSLTGGVSLSGIPMLPAVTVMGLTIDFASKKVFYYVILIALILTQFLIRRLVNSRTGRTFASIRENEDLAEALGMNVSRYKLMSFVTACAIAAVAGGLYANYMEAIEPEIAGGHMSFNLLVMIVVGGTRTIAGTIIGPLLLWFVPEFLEAAQTYRPLFFGLILIVVIILMPTGIAGKLKELHPRMAKWIP